ncbi:DNA-directed RNA polymerase III subunit 1 [Cucumis melo var. makuwa]|uniref:DNA-directed RNA polymerase n=1 Tax=Cucumis melo var. makuwa TaxID=1194695 RepID=A0A5A7T1Z0_CUCMM|nr:DNA-directed RNA polymerase III subunit 1 [Cucumis melo var. makuwa]
MAQKRIEEKLETVDQEISSIRAELHGSLSIKEEILSLAKSIERLGVLAEQQQQTFMKYIEAMIKGKTTMEQLPEGSSSKIHSMVDFNELMMTEGKFEENTPRLRGTFIYTSLLSSEKMTVSIISFDGATLDWYRSHEDHDPFKAVIEKNGMLRACWACSNDEVGQKIEDREVLRGESDLKCARDGKTQVSTSLKTYFPVVSNDNKLGGRRCKMKDQKELRVLIVRAIGEELEVVEEDDYTEESEKVVVRGDPSLTKTRVSLKHIMKTWTPSDRGFLIECSSFGGRNEICELYGIDDVSTIQESIRTVIAKFEDVCDWPGELPPQRSIEYHIHLQKGTNLVNVRPYRYAYQQKEMERLVNEMLAYGITRLSTSPYSSPVLLPADILGYHKNPATKEWEVLISWQGLPAHEATWDNYADFAQQFSHFHLEDKVSSERGSNDRPPIILQYSRRKKGEVTRAKENGNGGGSGNHLGGFGEEGCIYVGHTALSCEIQGCWGGCQMRCILIIFRVLVYCEAPPKALALDVVAVAMSYDCELLFLSDRPEKLIITNVLVPPIAIRPSVIMDGSQSNENDITERLKRIIQQNASVSQELSTSNSQAKCLVHFGLW